MSETEIKSTSPALGWLDRDTLDRLGIRISAIEFAHCPKTGEKRQIVHVAPAATQAPRYDHGATGAQVCTGNEVSDA